jgi:hypothetical protein
VTDESWQLSARQLDFLWARLDLGPSPYPLEIVSHGETVHERTKLGTGIEAECRELGLMTGGLVDADLAAALTLLARPGYWVDSQWTVAEPLRLIRVRSAADTRRALVAAQLPARPGRPTTLVLSRIRPSALVEETIAAIPREARGRNPGGSLPTTAFTGTRKTDGILREVRTEIDREAQTLRSMRGLLDQPHNRSGQFAANSRDRLGRRYRSPVVFWFDNAEDGRYTATVRRGAGRANWVTVTAAGPDQLFARLTECLDEVVDIRRGHFLGD